MEIIEKVKCFVKTRLEDEITGHDWWHSYRVWQMALHIAETEKESCDILVVQISALLHDVWDWKFLKSSETPGTLAKIWLLEQNVSDYIANSVCNIIDEISFKGAGTPNFLGSLEGKIVQDADRLDALGAIGIARTFAYGAYKNRQIYNPDIKPIYHTSFEDYKNYRGTTVNHFYEKLLLIKDKLNTETAKKIAAKRDAFMKTFLDQFFQEWELDVAPEK